ncbi:hypothetical protein NSPZN2_10160 [Nitrospira defluvii]|uniref:Uncharacterized protein n=1 Tax=Nitrospira defluvii TaxID=330214 RepID=A0ABM8QCF8_9BACT|nr:hypothetical protein NSPZN2_10160 [Nitrospira defluvii]
MTKDARDCNGAFQQKCLECLIIMGRSGVGSRGGAAHLAVVGQGVWRHEEEEGSGVEPGLSFTPALRAHQRPQRGDGTNRRQEHEACDEEKSTFHIMHRERSHDVTPLL